jgi:hypothetical protein
MVGVICFHTTVDTGGIRAAQLELPLEELGGTQICRGDHFLTWAVADLSLAMIVVVCHPFKTVVDHLLLLTSTSFHDWEDLSFDTT